MSFIGRDKCTWILEFTCARGSKSRLTNCKLLKNNESKCVAPFWAEAFPGQFSTIHIALHLSCKSPRIWENRKLLIAKRIEKWNLLGETKLVPPRKDRNANYLIIRSIYLRIMRGDLPVLRNAYSLWHEGCRGPAATICLKTGSGRAWWDISSIYPRSSSKE